MEKTKAIPSIFAPTAESVYRYEKKFVVMDQLYSEVEWVIKKHPFLFRSIFHPRQVNNIYFDTPQFEDFHDNVDGNSRRRKLRLRWYGDLFGDVKKSVMEAKIKSGDLGAKRNFSVGGFHMAKDFSVEKWTALLAGMPSEASAPFSYGYRPTLVNSYLRKYYLSADKRFRITVDWGLKYYKVGLSSTSMLVPLVDRRKIIVELKYDQEHCDSAQEITKHLPFRLSKNSKYVSGVRKTFFDLAENDDLGDAF
jgi:hypothetical protein